MHLVTTKEKSNQLSTSSRGPCPLARFPSFSIAWGHSFSDRRLSKCLIPSQTYSCLPYTCMYRLDVLSMYILSSVCHNRANGHILTSDCYQAFLVRVMRTFKISSLGLENQIKRPNCSKPSSDLHVCSTALRPCPTRGAPQVQGATLS